MAVKVKCRDCGTVAAAPDAARGKSIKCKDCGASIKVPSGEGGAAAKKAPAKKEKTIEDEDFFHHLDLDNVEDEAKRICPKCASKVTDEDIECPKCGINLETGQLSDRQRQRKKFISQGRDPDQFFKLAWSDPTEFLKANLGLAFQLAMFSAFAGSLGFCCQFLMLWFDRLPLKVFFGAISVIGNLAASGCFIQLYIHVIKQAMDDKKDIGRFNFDFFVDVALGLKIGIWPLAVMGPPLIIFSVFFGVLGALGVFDPQSDAGRLIASGVGGLLYLFGLLSFPVAISHLSAKFTYKAYLPGEMFRLIGRNFAAVSYWWLISFVLHLPVLIGAGLIGFFMEDVMAGLQSGIFKILELATIDTAEANRGALYYLVFPILGLIVVGAGMFFLTLLASFAAVFMTRLSGLFAYYNQPKLAMGDKRMAGQPVGFWVRYLAFLIDVVVIVCFCGGASVLVGAADMLITEIGIEGMEASFAMLKLILFGLIPFAYFVFTESGPGGATLGMGSMGMIVVNHEGKKPITRGQSITRFVIRLFGLVAFAGGLLMALWDKDKQTLHDKLSKTRVVWKPDMR